MTSWTDNFQTWEREGRSCNQVIDLIRLSWWNSSVLTQIMMIKSRSRRKRVQLNTSAISMELFHSIQLTKCFPGSLCSNFTRFSQVFILYKSLIIILPQNFNSFKLNLLPSSKDYILNSEVCCINCLIRISTRFKNTFYNQKCALRHLYWRGACFNFSSARLNQFSLFA